MVVTELVLFDRLLSPEEVEAEAVLVIVPALLGVTVMVTVALAPGASVPSEAVTIPPD